MKPNKIVDHEAEYIKIKKNNRSLAKALAEQQQLNKKFVDEITSLQKRLYVSSTMNMEYEKSLNEILKFQKNSLNNCIDISNNISTIMTLCKQGTNIQKSLLEDIDKNALNKVTLRSASPSNPHRTHAVKPMVSGHVIHSPTINLSRLTETRVAGLQSVDITVQNHNSTTHDTVNNYNENNIRSLSTNHLPVRGFTPEITENETDDSFEEESMNLENDSNVSNTRFTGSLGPLLEVSDEDSSSPNNNIVKEVRILIEPLHLDNHYHNTPILKQEKSRRTQDDPLEGTSSMMDVSGNLLGYNNYSSKPRQSSKRMCVQSDSDSEESTKGSEKKTRRWVTKRKASADKKDVTGQKYKIKRSSVNNSINDSLKRLSEETILTKSFEEIEYSNERRSRRSAHKSLAEPSLKSKLRR